MSEYFCQAEVVVKIRFYTKLFRKKSDHDIDEDGLIFHWVSRLVISQLLAHESLSYEMFTSNHTMILNDAYHACDRIYPPTI